MFFTLLTAFVFTISLHSKQVYIDDFSQLNKTPITDLIYPKDYAQLQELVQIAQENQLKVSVMGSRHSQGGHGFFDDALVVHLKNLNHILDFDPINKTITVQTGATWKDVQDFLNPHNCAVKIMQIANVFTVGGALSVNANGVDPHCGPFIESVRSIKIMLADGTIVTASRTENSELFYLAIGGYGLFGIILEATLDIVENCLYKRVTNYYSLEEYINHIQSLNENQSIGMHFAHLRFNAWGKKLFSDVMSMDFYTIDESTLSKRKIKRCKRLYQEKFVDIRRWEIHCLRESSFIKSIQWIDEAIKDGIIISRNNIMRPPATHIFCESLYNTQLLQEYFIPVENLHTFINFLEDITQQLDVNLMHVAFRFIPKNTESYLSYARSNCVGVVLLFSQKINPRDSQKIKSWTQGLIDTAIELEGTYYLPIQLHAEQEQIRRAYPKLDNFFAFKKNYDPSELWFNHFYNKYALDIR